MQLYRSTKVVHGEKMSSSDWMSIRHNLADKGVGYSDATLEPNQAGYHVVYNKGTDAEYHSWTPDAQFVDGHEVINAAE